MKFSGFAPEVRDRLQEFLARHHAKRDERKIAVFDADGTLWHGDVGEAFFRHQVEAGTVPHAPRANAWQVYFEESIRGDAEKAYGWLAQWNAGVRESDLMAWATEYFSKHWKPRVFEPMREFTHALAEAGFETWIVSGSIHWIVAAGAHLYGIPRERVIGTAVTVENGVLTDRIDGVVPYRGGKTRMIEMRIGQHPVFAAGNTYWDMEMLTSATELALATHSENKGEPNFESEQRLQELARANNWLSQRFLNG